MGATTYSIDVTASQALVAPRADVSRQAELQYPHGLYPAQMHGTISVARRFPNATKFSMQ
jgi:hypothetical protein